MKVNHYHYWIQQKSNNKKFIVDIRPFLINFIENSSNEFKNKFTVHNDNIYLFKSINNGYLFFVTKNDEIIKKINSVNLEYDQIDKMLSSEEKLAFVSYLNIESSFFSFGSTFHSPRFPRFIYFMNELFNKLDLNDYEFVSEPIYTKISKNDVLNLNFIGKTVIRSSKEQNFSKKIIEQLFANVDNFDEIDSFEITIRPKKRKSIDKTIKQLVGKIDEKELNLLTLKGKIDEQDSLTDLYVVSQGILSLDVNSKNDLEIFKSLEEEVKQNQILRSKVDEHTQNGEFSKTDITGISSNFKPFTRDHSF